MEKLTSARLYKGNKFDEQQRGQIMVRGILNGRGFSEIPLQQDLRGRKFIIIDNKTVYLKIEISIDDDQKKSA